LVRFVLGDDGGAEITPENLAAGIRHVLGEGDKGIWAGSVHGR
jgi:hypothetical protein